MSPQDVMLRAYDLLEGALLATSADEAVSATRLDLEVLSREDLLRVALCLTIEPTRVLVRAADRASLLDRVQRRRLHVMVAGS